MKNLITKSIIFFLFLTLSTNLYSQLIEIKEITKESKKQGVQERSKENNFEFEEEEENGLIVGNKEISKEQLFDVAKARQILNKKVKKYTGVPNIVWTPKGPFNVGGVVNCLMYDPNDNTKKKVWAGTEYGGVWYNNDLTNTTSQWQKVGGDFWDCMSISSLTFDPTDSNIYYAATGLTLANAFNHAEYGLGAGIYKSTDQGQTWNKLNSTTTNYDPNNSFFNVSKIKVNHLGQLFACTAKGLFKSIDKGNTWIAQSVAGNSALSFYDIEIDSDNAIYIGTNYPSAGQIYKSTDNGITWSNISPQVSAFQGSGVQITVAKDAINNVQVVYTLYCKYGDIDNTKIGDVNWDRPLWFYKSINGGASWVNLKGNLSTNRTYNYNYCNVLEIDPNNTNIIYQAGIELYRSTNGGISWDYPILPGHPDIHAMLLNPMNPNDCLSATDGGVYYSSNLRNQGTPSYNASFSSKNLGLSITEITHLSQKNVVASPYIFYSTMHNHIREITDAGIEPASYILWGEGRQVFVDQNEPNIQIYQNYGGGNIINGSSISNMTSICSYDNSNNKLYSYKAANLPLDKNSYIDVVSGIATTHVLTKIPIDTLIIPKGYDGKLKLSKNNDFLYLTVTSTNFLYKINISNQTITTIMNQANGFIKDISFGASDNEIVYCTMNKKIFYSNDGGSTWVDKNLMSYGLPNIPIYSIIFNPNNTKQVLIGTEFGVWGTNDITAANPNWQLANTELANTRCTVFNYRSADHNLLVGTTSRGIYSSNVFNPNNKCKPFLTIANPNEASNFTASDSITSISKIQGTNNVVKYYANKIILKPGFKVSNGGGFRSYIEPCNPNAARKSAQQEEYPIVMEQKEELLDIYPNPVENKEFSVAYTVTNKGNINLHLTTPEGRSIKSILNDKFHEPGNYEIKVKVAEVGEGLYLCVFSGNDLFETKKVLIK